MRKRTRFELALSVFENLAEGPLILSHLMTKVNINHKTTMLLLRPLIEHGLIEKTDASISYLHKKWQGRKAKYQYQITEQGREMLERDVKRDVRLCWMLGLDFSVRKSRIRG